MKQFCHNPIATGAFLISLFFTLDIDAQSSVIAQGQSLNGVPTNQILQMPVQTPVAPPAVINFQQLANFYSYPAFQPPRAITQLEDIDEDFVVEPSIIPAGAPVTIIPEGGPKALSSSPAPTGQWNGTLQNVQLIPPDIRGAASSGNWVMETNNEQFDIWNKTGTHLSTLSYDNFFSASGGSGFFDPHILYDATYNRFIVCSGGNNSSGQNAVFLAVSQTNNPTGNWYVYNVANNGQTGNGILDYPLMGYNNNWVVITARDFGSNNVTPHIYVMNRANTYAGTLGTVSNFTDNDGITLGAAQTYDATQNTEYLVSNANGNSGGNGYMKIAAITGTATAPVYSSGGNIGVNQTWGDNQGLAVGAAQSGGTTIECGDARTGNAVFINGSLWFTHTVFLPTANPTHCGVDWWQVNPVSSTVQQYGRIADATGAKYYFYPSINVNANGDALLGYCESSTSTFAGAAYSFHANFDAVNTMESDTVYKHGLANYSQTLGGGRNRYGDYSGTAMDPTDGSFWNFSEWTNTGSQWGTVVAHIPAAVIPHVPPVTNFIADVTTTCTGLVNFTDLSTGLPTSWLWNFGDGNTSTLQNPGHLYILNGTYTVQLTATNAYGSTPKIVAGYIVVNKPAGPAGTGASHCGASTFSLSASTTNHVAWRDSTGAVVSITNPFITPTLSHTTTYYVEDTIPNAAVTVGPVSNTALSATGGFFSNSTDRYLTFDAAAAFTLVSVTVYAQTAGSRIIEFRNSAGTALQTATVTLAIGTNVVTLNFNIPVGTGYELGINGASNLYRNNDGGTVNYFPFTLPGVVSITGSNAGAGFYYYFYNWQVKSGYCLSQGTAVTATINPSLVLGAGSVTNVTCNGLSNGSATVAVSGGTPTYIYHWSNSQSTATASNLAAGTFPVTITDAAGCSVTTSKTVTQPNALNVSVTPTNAGCSTPGKAVASVTGGTTAYTYSWNQGSSNGNVDSNLTAGIYLLTVTDAHSCTASVSVTISSTGGLTLSPSATNVNCFGNHTGSVSVTASGGSGTTHYTWSTTDTTQTVSNLAAGTYLVTVTEGPCSAIATQVVTQPNVLAVTATATGAGCGSQQQGTVTANVTGGTTGYLYHWSNLGNTPTISSLGAGQYFVTVTDNHSCTASAVTTVNSASSLIAILSSTPTNCYASATGSATATVTSGTLPYTYAWTGGGITATVNNLNAGTYFVTITDGDNCAQTDTVTVSQPDSISVSLNTVAASCNALSDGSANVSASGGSPSYTFTWSTTSTGPALTNLGAGNYSVVTKDSHNCTAVANFTITEPTLISPVPTIINDSCNGDHTGSAQLNATGGTGPYVYVWNSTHVGNSLSGLAAGSYIATVSDSHNCSVTTTVTVTQPTQLQVYTSSTDDGGSGTGTALVDSINGGTGPYTIVRWSNGQTTNPATSLTAGTYTVTVTDHNGCVQTATVVVNLATGISNIANDLSFNIYPNPAKTEVTVELNNKVGKETTLYLQDVLGQTLHSETISTVQTKIDLAGYANGVYFISVKQGSEQGLKKFLISR